MTIRLEFKNRAANLFECFVDRTLDQEPARFDARSCRSQDSRRLARGVLPSRDPNACERSGLRKTAVGFSGASALSADWTERRTNSVRTLSASTRRATIASARSTQNASASETICARWTSNSASGFAQRACRLHASHQGRRRVRAPVPPDATAGATAALRSEPRGDLVRCLSQCL